MYPGAMPSAEVQRQMDIDHLRLLSVFHYVLGGLGLLFGLLPLFYVGMGWMMLSGAIPMNDPNGAHAPEAAHMMGWMMILVGVFLTLLMLGMALLVIYAGHSLSQRRRWMFCMVMACIQCLSVPFGTVLGIFTILALNRPSVRALFGVAGAGV